VLPEASIHGGVEQARLTAAGSSERTMRKKYAEKYGYL
jgi:hypothetical protein